MIDYDKEGLKQANISFTDMYKKIQRISSPESQIQRMLPQYNEGDTIYIPSEDIKATIIKVTIKVIPIEEGAMATIYEFDNGYSYSTAGYGSYYKTKTK